MDYGRLTEDGDGVRFQETSKIEEIRRLTEFVAVRARQVQPSSQCSDAQDALRHVFDSGAANDNDSAIRQRVHEFPSPLSRIDLSHTESSSVGQEDRLEHIQQQ